MPTANAKKVAQVKKIAAAKKAAQVKKLAAAKKVAQFKKIAAAKKAAQIKKIELARKAAAKKALDAERKTAARKKELERKVAAAARKKELIAKQRAATIAAKEKIKEKLRMEAERKTAKAAIEAERQAVKAAREAERVAKAEAKAVALEAALKAKRKPVPPPRPTITKTEFSDGMQATKEFDLRFLANQREALLLERGKLLGQATRLEDEANSLIEDVEMGDVQFDEEGGEGDTMVVERERDLTLSAQARYIADEIDSALDRIRLGEYGYSVHSGLPIPRERLKAIPWTTESVLERVGGINNR